MTSGVEHAPWVGRPLPRVEDDALLRGEGRFLDDLHPVPHARHAAIVRSLLPHARITVDLQGLRFEDAEGRTALRRLTERLRARSWELVVLCEENLS